MPISLVSDERAAVSAAWQFQRTGNFVAALDLAQESLRRWPASHALQYIGILALASCGSTQAALDTLQASALRSNADEDSQALEARLLKDLAFSRFGTASQVAAAAAAYEQVAERTRGTYSRQNSALLWMLAGDHERALALSAAVMQQLQSTAVPGDDDGAYFYWATLAEAALVLGDPVEFERARQQANVRCRRNAWARARTRQQMGRLSARRPELMALVGQWYQPPVGVVLDSKPSAEWGQASAIDRDDLPALVYCFHQGPATQWHELAALGVQLHAIYPTAPAAPSATPASDLQLARDASGHADTHTWSSLFLDELDDERSTAWTALGLSLGHADELRAPWIVLSKSADQWSVYRNADRAAVCVAIGSTEPQPSQRSTYGFLFADAVSYSSLNVEETRRYWRQLLPQTAAAVIQRHAGTVVLRKTWGDAVHAVFTSASGAARAALEIQQATASLREELGRGRRLAFRIALHYGTADEGMDPVEQTPSVFGPQLSLAARIEPVAPPGGVFVTEALAARLSLEGAADLRCAYVGTTRLPKSYGRVRLLSLA